MKIPIIIFQISILFIISLNCYAQEKPELVIPTGHSLNASGATFSKNSEYLISFGTNELKIWDVFKGIEIRTITCPNVDGALISPDNKFILTHSSINGEINIWNFTNGMLIRKFDVEVPSNALFFNNDSHCFFSAETNGEIKKWDINTGKITIELDLKNSFNNINAFAVEYVTKNKNFIYYRGLGGKENEAVLYALDVKSQKFFGCNLVVKHNTSKLRFSENGRFVIKGFEFDIDNFNINDKKDISIYNNTNCKKVLSISDIGIFDEYLFSQDDKKCIVIRVNQNWKDVSIELLNIEESKRIRVDTVNLKYGIIASSLSEDDKYLCLCGGNGDIVIWDLVNNSVFKTLGSLLEPQCAFYSNNTSNIIIGNKVIDVPTGIDKFGDESKNIKIYPSNNEKLALASMDSIGLCIINILDKSVYCNLEDSNSESEEITAELLNNSYGIDSIKNIASIIFFNFFDKTLFINNYDLQTGKKLNKINLGISMGQISPNGEFALTTSLDGSINIWDLKSSNLQNELQLNSNKTVISGIFLNNTKGVAIYSISSGKSIIDICDFETGEILKNYNVENCRRLISITYDDKYVICETNNNQIVFYDLDKGIICKTIENSNIYATNVSVSKDYKYILVSSSFGRFIVYDFNSSKELFTFYLLKNGDWVLKAPDGRFDGTLGGLKQLYYVQGLNVLTFDSFYEKLYYPKLWASTINADDTNVFNSEIDFSKSLKLPPLVNIINPKVEDRGVIFNQNYMSESQTIEISVEVTDQGGGIDEILLYHNGKLVETTNRGFKLVEENEEKSLKTFTVNLANGDNRIKVTAFNLQRIEAIPAEIVVNYTIAEEIKPNLYLLVIGINEYKNTKYNLNYAIEDAVGFKRQIEIGAKELFNSIVTISLSNAEATKDRIMEEINKIKAIAQQQDMFVFYYAGHGAMSVEDKSVFYLIPTDVTQMFSAPVLEEKAISASELKEISTEIKAQKQIFILDACQSGGIEDVLAVRGAAEEKAIAQLARSTGTYWLAASTTEQFAGEFAQLGHGIFTYCILQAFNGAADGQGDNKITVQELSAYLNDQVPIISKQYKGSEQYPVTYGFGQDFPIILIKK